MKLFARMKIVSRLLLSFSLILLGVLYLGIPVNSSLNRLESISDHIFSHPFTVSTAVLALKSDILQHQLNIAKLLHIDELHVEDKKEIERLIQVVLDGRIEEDRRLALVRERLEGNKLELEQVVTEIIKYRATTDHTFSLIRDGRQAEAIAKWKLRDMQIEESLIKELDLISMFAAKEAAQSRDKAVEESRSAKMELLFTIFLLTGAGVILALLTTKSVTGSFRLLVSTMQGLTEGSREKILAAEAIGAGDLDKELVSTAPLRIDLNSIPKDELGKLMQTAVKLSEMQASLDDSFRRMTTSLRRSRTAERTNDWLKTGQNELLSLLRGEQETIHMTENVLSFLAGRLGAGVAVFYLFDRERQDLSIIASYAFTRRKRLSDRIQLGEGLAGQAALEKKKICLLHVPPDYLPISSALGEATPVNVIALPLVHNGLLMGVLELGTFKEFTDTELEFLDQAAENLAISLGVNLARQQVNELLTQTQAQAEELRTQQEELQQNNEELAERSLILEQQRAQIQTKNVELETTGRQLEIKAMELERASTYKSEFLANMSHEVRTPLNSLMILSRLLMDNKEGNLTEKQVEFAATINKAGNELLNLINDILDLSKVEAGRLEITPEESTVADLCAPLESMFRPLAEHKGLSFAVNVEENVPLRLTVDIQRTQQILRNLLANACKFTQEGSVRLRVLMPEAAANPMSGPAVAFAVEDTGIGVAKEKHQLIFQAFQQADGATSRRFGGTGLGLSISLHLAHLMGGEITLESTEGKGSVFTFYLPLSPVKKLVAPVSAPIPSLELEIPPGPLSSTKQDKTTEPDTAIPDDRAQLQEGTRVILIIEDDTDFAKILMDMVRSKGFSCILAVEGESGVLLAERYLPAAIILDVMLPGINGWEVMRMLKDSPGTRHIPVHFLTCLDDRRRAIAMGAIGLATKPSSPEQIEKMLDTIEEAIKHKVKHLLVVEDNEDEARSIEALLGGQDIVISLATTGHKAIELLEKEPFDCLVLDLGLADMSGFELLDHIQTLEERRQIPVIIHSGRELSHDEEVKLRHYTESIILKGAKSPERLMAEVSLFLHRVEKDLPDAQQKKLRPVLDQENLFVGKKILIVDDDMRNVFSLSAVLAGKQVIVVEAENGNEAIARFDEHPDVSLVLMDIMMPEMDGYEAIRQIRKKPSGRNLPIIAMTAKALRGDREECLRAGASDYIAKPIDIDKLLSLLRVWLFSQV